MSDRTNENARERENEGGGMEKKTEHKETREKKGRNQVTGTDWAPRERPRMRMRMRIQTAAMKKTKRHSKRTAPNNIRRIRRQLRPEIRPLSGKPHLQLRNSSASHNSNETDKKKHHHRPFGISATALRIRNVQHSANETRNRLPPKWRGQNWVKPENERERGIYKKKSTVKQ